MSNTSSADALLGSLKNLQKEKPTIKETNLTKPDHSSMPEIPNPLETSKRVREYLEQQVSNSQQTSASYPSYTEPIKEKRVVVQKGEDFVVEVREKRAVKKNFLMSPSIANSLANEAKTLGISQNELINQILKQRYL